MHNPNKSNFNIIIPPDFFVESIVKKYNAYFSYANLVQNNIADILTESIQSVNFPEIGYNPISQTTQDVNNGGYNLNQIPKESEQNLINDKLISITFRHIDGYITYFMVMELIYTFYQMGGDNPTKRKTFSPIILETLSTHTRTPICRWKLYKCMISGLSPLSLAFNETERDVQTFDVTFAYTEFETTVNIPQPIIL